MTPPGVRTETGRLARLLHPNLAHAVEVRPHEIVIAGREGEVRLAREVVDALECTRGLLGDRLRIVRRDGESAIELRGLPRDGAATIVALWHAWGVAPLVTGAARAFRALLEGDAYVNRRALGEWRATACALDGALPAVFDTLPLASELLADIGDARRFLADAERIVEERNDRFVRGKRREHDEWFTRAGGAYALTREQREAILHDEDNCLVVAGAGTGKTSTVAGKVGYLLRTGAARPENILLLSFTKKAATEMAERIARTVGEELAGGVAVRTFHGLGLEILAAADGRKPALSALAADSAALVPALGQHLRALFDEPAAQAEVAELFAYYLYPYRSPFDFATAEEYRQYVRDHELKTLRGEKVRSHEHLVIANWLHVNGIPYAYRRAYAYDTATDRHRQYQPDFHLVRNDVYVEHLAIDREGRTPPQVDAARYHKAMEWRRALHRRHDTRLVETFHHERAEGTLLGALKMKLRALGVVPRPLPPASIRAAADEQKLIEPLARLLGTFLSLFKGNLWTLAELEAAAQAPAEPAHGVRDPARAIAFLRVFRRVLARYEAQLASAREIDFNDMIAAATERVESRRYVSRFTHVIVDEFQDLSRGRGRLLRALLAQVPDRRLFCVGDDWQSIYRFTGSDIAQMTNFAAEFGFTRRCDLTVTHRFPRELLDASSHFVQQNPAQLRKSLVTARALGEPAIELHARAAGEDAGALLERVLARIAEQAAADRRAAGRSETAPPTVQVLGRYNFTRPAGWDDLQRRHAGLAMEFLTVHRSKGLEADYTVLVDLVAGRMGFPSEMVDDPLLDLVLAGAGEFPNAEERRVFYVALTRARTRCYVLTDARKPSRFVEELAREEYSPWVTRGAGRAGGPSPVCPDCGGTLMRLEGQHEEHYGCGHLPPSQPLRHRCG